MLSMPELADIASRPDDMCRLLAHSLSDREFQAALRERRVTSEMIAAAIGVLRQRAPGAPAQPTQGHTDTQSQVGGTREYGVMHAEGAPRPEREDAAVADDVQRLGDGT